MIRLTGLNRTGEIEVRMMTMTKKRMVVVASGRFINRGFHVLVPEKMVAITTHLSCRDNGAAAFVQINFVRIFL
jgi:hypothetical protein